MQERREPLVYDRINASQRRWIAWGIVPVASRISSAIGRVLSSAGVFEAEGRGGGGAGVAGGEGVEDEEWEAGQRDAAVVEDFADEEVEFEGYNNVAVVIFQGKREPISTEAIQRGSWREQTPEIKHFRAIGDKGAVAVIKVAVPLSMMDI